VNFVYICRNGENEELRYSIRSIEKYFSSAEIWVVGGRPNWYSGKYIEVKDIGSKFQNINNCYKNIIKDNRIGIDFVIMNDDFFLLSNKNNYNYYDGTIKDKINSHIEINGNSSYARALKGCVKALKERGIEQPLNYDVHTPMTLNKANLAEVIDLSLAPRSMYGNIFLSDGIKIKDVKIYKRSTNIDLTKDFISTEDNSFTLIKDKLNIERPLFLMD
jgi:hypothetical protein